MSLIRFLYGNIVWTIIFLSGSQLFGQQKEARFLNKTALEAGWGLHYPAKPADKFLHRNYIDGKSFYLGGRYEINKLWGVRLSYAYNKFQNSKNKDNYFELSLTQHKFVSEIIFNVVAAFEQDSDFEIMMHSGMGMTLGKNGFLSGADKTLTAQFGVMPIYRFADHFAIQLDMTLVFDFFQAYDIDGIPVSDRIGNYYLANIGLTYFFGS